jgi:hypothetical protein
MFKKMTEKLFLGSALLMASATSAFADFTVPTLPVGDLETAGAAVAGLVAAYVLIKIVIRMIKGA